MAVNEAAMAAIKSAMIDATAEERNDSQKRFLIMLEAALPHLQVSRAPVPPPEAGADVTMLMSFSPVDEAQRERINELRKQSIIELKVALEASSE